MKRSMRTFHTLGFGAAVACALAFGAHAALAAPPPGPGEGRFTCNKWKESSVAGCVASCERIGEYYYYWNPSTEWCCCTPIAP